MNLDRLNTIASRVQTALDGNLFEQFKWLFEKYVERPFDMPINDLDLVLIYTDYVNLFNADGMKALIGYVQWSEKELTGPEADAFVTIKGTIAHDLGERNEPCMLPRSSGYLKYYQDPATARAAIRKFPWVKRLRQAHLYTSGNHSTDCGKPMLGNNYATAYKQSTWDLCPGCHPRSVKTEDLINWKPLEILAEKMPGVVDLDDYMHMGPWKIKTDYGSTDTVEIQMYKHRDTRHYINIDDDGAYWKYTADDGEYIEISEVEAVSGLGITND